MIHSVELISVLKSNDTDNVFNKLDLWPVQRKAIKVNPDFNIKEYYFKVKTTK